MADDSTSISFFIHQDSDILPLFEIFLDAINGGRRGRAHEARFELLTMGMIVDPFTRCRNPLARRDDGSMTNNRDKIAMATGFNPDDAKAILGVVVSDPLDQSGQNFLGR